MKQKGTHQKEGVLGYSTCLFEHINQFDPAQVSSLSLAGLAELSNRNDKAAAQNSLDATLHQWTNGEPILCRDWINNLINEIRPLAIDMDMVNLLSPLEMVLSDGNQAMKWVKSYSDSKSIELVLQKSILEMEKHQKRY